MRTVSDSLAYDDLRPPNITSNTLCGDSCRAESEWKYIVQSQSQGGIAEECIQYQTNLESKHYTFFHCFVVRSE